MAPSKANQDLHRVQVIGGGSKVERIVAVIYDQKCRHCCAAKKCGLLDVTSSNRIGMVAINKDGDDILQTTH